MRKSATVLQEHGEDSDGRHAERKWTSSRGEEVDGRCAERKWTAAARRGSDGRSVERERTTRARRRGGPRGGRRTRSRRAEQHELGHLRGEGDGGCGSVRMITAVPKSAVPMSPWLTRTSEKVRPPSRLRAGPTQTGGVPESVAVTHWGVEPVGGRRPAEGR